MGLKDDPHKAELRKAGWHSRGYLPHFDGRPVPQFITLHLGDSVPKQVIDKWRAELRVLKDEEQKRLLRFRIEKYLDQGYGSCFLKDEQIAFMVQNALLKFDGVRYRLHAWVVMPNHLHLLMTRFDEFEIKNLMQAFKSYTAHQANKILGRKGEFWMDDYFDRWTRDERHFRATVRYIENNPVKAGLCAKPEEWPFCSAWFRARKKKLVSE